MATTTPRDPATRRDRRPRAAQGDKAPRSLDYPKEVDGATNYLLAGIPPNIKAKFDERAEADDKSMRWLLLRFMEKYGAREITLALLLALAATGCAAPAPAWEYAIKTPADQTLEADLNAYGKDGWEIVSARRASGAVFGDPDEGPVRVEAAYELILKRQVRP